jgi:excisionase family DNA binding protein
MNKREASQYLGKTERAVERYTQAGELSVKYKPGKTRPVADYDETELRELKHRLANPSEVRPAVVSETPTKADQPRPTSTQALQRAGGEQGISMLASVLADALRATHDGKGGGQASIADLANKMTLSFGEAARLSGVPEDHLRAAHKAGELRGAKIGRGVRVTPDDVRKYVEQRMKGKK